MRVAVVAVRDDALNSVSIATLADAKRILLYPQWLKRNFKKNPDALYAFYISQKALPEVLRDTLYQTWTDEQLNIFCGLPVHAKSSQCNEERGTDDLISEEEFLPQFILPPYATANENETIGF